MKSKSQAPTSAAGVRDTDADWVRIGEDNPYWGVISADRFRGNGLNERDKADFFGSGERYVNDVLGFVTAHFGPLAIENSLDFGCGVGRILVPLAKYTKGEAIGVDVSPGMRDLAQRRADELEVANVRLLADIEGLRAEGRTFDFVNSFIVLQHIPPVRGLAILSDLLALTRIHGVFSLQLTFAKAARHLSSDPLTYRYYRREGGAVTLLDSDPAPQQVGEILMFDYDLNEVFARVLPYAGHPLMILPTDHDGHLGVHLIGQKVR